MKTRPVLITLLIAAHISIAMAVVAGTKLPGRYGDWLPMAVVSTGQIGLLSIWTALGRRATPWRPAVLIAAIVGWSWIETAKNGGGTHWLVVFLPVAATTVAILLAARIRGLRLYLPEDNRGGKCDRWQFTLQSLFAWTTSLAFCLGIVIFALRDFRIGQSTNWPAEIFMTTVFIVSVIVTSTYFAWIRPRFSYTLCSTIYALLMAALLTYWCFGPQLSITIGVYCALEMSFLIASLLVLRVAGYRLEMKKTRL